MKENKIGIISTIPVVIISLLLTFLSFFPNINNDFLIVSWVVNFSFAIFGSALVSLIVFTINYLVLRKKIIKQISSHFSDLALLYRIAVDYSHRFDLIKCFSDEVFDFYDECLMSSFDDDLLKLSKREKKLAKQFNELFHSVYDLAFQHKEPLNELKKNNDYEKFNFSVKKYVKNVLINIIKIEDIFYSKKDLLKMKEKRIYFNDYWGGLDNEQN